MQYSARDIFERLKERQVAVIATDDSKSGYVRLRVMYYGVTDKFECYLMTLKDSPKLSHLAGAGKVSVLIYSLENPFDLSWECELNGFVSLLNSEQEQARALEELKGRNPFADVALEAGLTAGHFAFLKLSPTILRFRVYSEALNNEPPTVIEF